MNTVDSTAGFTLCHTVCVIQTVDPLDWLQKLLLCILASCDLHAHCWGWKTPLDVNQRDEASQVTWAGIRLAVRLLQWQLLPPVNRPAHDHNSRAAKMKLCIIVVWVTWIWLTIWLAYFREMSCIETELLHKQAMNYYLWVTSTPLVLLLISVLLSYSYSFVQ